MGADEVVAGIDMVGALQVVIEVADKVHCSNLGVSALRNAINNYINRMEDSYENSCVKRQRGNGENASVC